MNHYVIGDVHGHYDTLIALVAKLPRDARLVFVGDLIDRRKRKTVNNDCMYLNDIKGCEVPTI